MKVEIPERDTPRWPIVAVVGAVALASGLAIAFWGTSQGRGDEADEPPPASAEPTDLEAEAEAEADAEAEAEADAEAEAEAEADADADADAEAEDAEPEADAEAEAEPQSEAEAEPRAEADPAPEPAAEPTPEPVRRSTPIATPAATPSGPLRVRRGRVAYLRCDQASGRACPRDEGMEQAVWAAIEGLAACPSGPRTGGEADVRLDYRGDEAPTVEWRDTFADEVQRLDRDTVLGCLRAGLGATRRTIDAERLLVSFRFSME